MVKNPKFLKNLLTTASVVALASLAGSAIADDNVTVANPAITSTGVGIRNAGANPRGAGALVAGDVVYIANPVHVVQNKGPAGIIIDIYGNDNATISFGGLTNAFTLRNTFDGAAAAAVAAANGGAAVAAGGAGGAAKAKIVLADNATYRLNQASTALVKEIDLANAGDLTIHTDSNNVEFTTLFKSTGGAKDIVVDAVGVKFSDVGGATAFSNADKIGNLTVNAQKSAILNTHLILDTNLILAGAAGNASTFTVAAGKNITAAEVTGGGAAEGKLVFEGNSEVVATVGTTAPLASIAIGNGTVEFKGTAADNDIAAAAINLTNANSVMKVSTRAQDIAGDISNTSGVNNKGIIELNGNFAHNLAGRVGVDANTQLEAIKFTGAGAASSLTLKAGANAVNGLFVGKITTDTDNKGIVVLRQGAAQAIYGDLGEEGGNKLNNVTLYSDNAGALTTVTLKAGKKITATTVDLTAAGANFANVLVLEEGTKINGNVDTQNGGSGIIQVKGNTAITGAVGATRAIARIDLADAAAAGKKITIGGVGNQGFGAIAFAGNDATVELTGTTNSNITTVITTAASNGTITSAMAAGQTLTLTGQIGDVAAASNLKLLKVDQGGNVTLGGGTAHIAEINMGTDKDGTLTLSNAGNYKIVKLTHGDGKVRLGITAAITLKNGSVLSAADNKLKDLYFTGNRALTIEDGVNLYTTAGFSNDGEGNGSLIAKGTSTISGKVGNNNAVGAITIDSTNTTKTLTFLDEVNSVGDVTINNTDTIVFKNNLTARSITGGAPGNKGTVEFTNTEAATIALTAAGAQNLEVLKISGGDLNFTKHLPVAATYTFGDKAATITVSNSGGALLDLTGHAITTTSTTRNQNFKLGNGDLTLDKVGEANKHFGTFSVAAGKNIIVNHADFFASVGGAGANATFNAVDGKVDNIGAANAKMKDVTFTQNTEVAGNSYAEKLTVAANRKGTFHGIVAGGDVILDNGAAPGAPTTAVFKDGSSLLSTLSGTVDAKAIVDFEGETTIGNGLGKAGTRLAEINFKDTANKTQSLAGEFYGVKTTFKKTKAQATDKVTFHGQVLAENTTIDLGTAGIILTDGDVANPSKISGEIVVMTTFNGTTNGELTLSGTNTKADVSGVTSLNVVLNDTTKGRVRTTGTVKVLDVSNANFIGLAAVAGKVDGQSGGNPNVDWAFDKANLRFTSTDISDKVAAKNIAANGGTVEAQQNVQKFYDAPVGTIASDYADELAELASLDAKVQTESVNRISSSTANTSTAAVTAAIAQSVSSTTTARMQTLANPAALRVTQADGVSAGAEDTLRYGVWGSPFYSQSVQKMRKGVSGYKSKTAGGTIGFDTMANDTMIVGVAATIAKTDLKHKDVNAGDKTKADTLMFSIYGLQEINNDWFLQGVATFGSTKVKNTSKRIGALNGAVNAQTATGKYDSMSWGGELLSGYNFNVSSMAVVTPMLGLDYSRTNDGGYTETGTRNQNLNVSKKSVDRVQAVAGIRAVMADIEQGGFVITPEVHGFVRQSLGNKQPKLAIKLDGAGELATNKVKAAKTSGNLGLGINASSGMMTYGLTYDAHMANKYVGHQGTFKVRVNF